jgi:hypothetical protein
MTPAIRFPLVAAGQVLAGGRAPAFWRRQLARTLEPLHQLSRAGAWIAPLTGLRPRLSSVPLWGTELAQVTRFPREAEEQAGLRGRPRPSFAGLRGEKPPSPRKVARAFEPKRSLAGAVPASLSQAVKPGLSVSVPDDVRALAPHAAQELLLRLAGREVPRGDEAAPQRDRPFRRPAPSPGRSGAPAPPLAEKEKRFPSSRLQGAVQPPLSAREQKKIEAWQRQIWARVRHSLVHVPAGSTASSQGNAAFGKAVRLPGHPPVFGKKAFSPGNPPAGDFAMLPGDTSPLPAEALRRDGTRSGSLPADSGHSSGTATVASPWQLLIAGETVGREILIALAGGARPDNIATPGKPPSRAPSGRGEAGERPGAARESAPSPGANPRGKPVSETPGSSRKLPEALPPEGASAAPRPFDRPLRELLHRDHGREGRLPAGLAPFSDVGAPSGFSPGKGEIPVASPSGEAGDSFPEPPTAPTPPVSRQALSTDGEELERLTEQLQRILQEEARRHGIDV